MRWQALCLNQDKAATENCGPAVQKLWRMKILCGRRWKTAKECPQALPFFLAPQELPGSPLLRRCTSERLAWSFWLTVRMWYRYTIHSDREFPPSRSGEVLFYRLEGRDSTQTRCAAETSTVCIGQCEIAFRHECPGLEAASTYRPTGGALGCRRQWQLETDFQV